jgi:hypothetical protein
MGKDSLESKRFGYHISRYVTDHMSDAFLKSIQDDQPDVAIIRMPAAHLDSLYSTPNIFKYRPIIADSLVYLEAVPRKMQKPDGPYQFRNEKLDPNGILQTARKAFWNYKNHYLVNPLFSAEKAQEGFVEWADTLLNDSSCKFWVAQKGLKTIGFAACRADGPILHVVLNAVDPDCTSNGIYSGLVDQILNDCVGHFEKVSIATQAHNIAVQRIWQKRQATVYKVLSTIHLNFI